MCSLSSQEHRQSLESPKALAYLFTMNKALDVSSLAPPLKLLLTFTQDWPLIFNSPLRAEVGAPG